MEVQTVPDRDGNAMSATVVSAPWSHAESHAEWLARQPIEFMEQRIQRHERLQRHGKATPASIARHQADIAELRAAIEQRKSVTPITSRSPARMDAAERLRLRRAYDQCDDTAEIVGLLMDSFARRTEPRRLLKLVTATRGPNRTPTPNLRMEASYALARREIRSVK